MRRCLVDNKSCRVERHVEVCLRRSLSNSLEPTPHVLYSWRVPLEREREREREIFIRIKQATKWKMPIKPGAYCLSTYQ